MVGAGGSGGAVAIILDSDPPRRCTHQLPDGRLHGRVPMLNGLPYRLEASCDLVNWEPVVSNVVMDDGIDFVEAEPEICTHRSHGRKETKSRGNAFPFVLAYILPARPSCLKLSRQTLESASNPERLQPIGPNQTSAIKRTVLPSAFMQPFDVSCETPQQALYSRVFSQ
jgi:hypothetical protein